MNKDYKNGVKNEFRTYPTHINRVRKIDPSRRPVGTLQNGFTCPKHNMKTSECSIPILINRKIKKQVSFLQFKYTLIHCSNNNAVGKRSTCLAATFLVEADLWWGFDSDEEREREREFMQCFSRCMFDVGLEWVVLFETRGMKM